MTVALIDNGSLQPAAHRLLRETAASIAKTLGANVEAVSWKHSDRIAARVLSPRAQTLAKWFPERLAAGETDFLFLPFFLSPGGAIASAIQADLRASAPKGIRVRFAAGLADSGVLPAILADRIRTGIRTFGLSRPSVVVVDHGGPAPASAALRDRTTAAVAALLGDELGSIAAASMESPEGPEFEFNRPLFPDALAAAAESGRPVLVAPLFLAPGRHAGPGGDLRRLARAAEERHPALPVRFTGLVGTHPLAAGSLAAAARGALMPRAPVPTDPISLS